MCSPVSALSLLHELSLVLSHMKDDGASHSDGNALELVLLFAPKSFDLQAREIFKRCPLFCAFKRVSEFLLIVRPIADRGSKVLNEQPEKTFYKIGA